MKRFLVLMSSLLLAASAALAETGTAVGVDPDALADFQGTVRTLVVGADVSVGETVVTGPSGQVEIIFSDKTKLVVGPGSQLLIEDYLLRNATTADKVAVSALAGTFRFVTGTSPKSAYQIKTPTGTIGVRGTAFDFTVVDQTTSVVLYHGAVRICAKSGKCVELTSKCEAGSYDLRESVVLRSQDKFDDGFRGLFPYAINEMPLRREFRIAGARQCLIRPDGGTPGGSLLDPSVGGGNAPAPTVPAPTTPLPCRTKC